MWVNNKYNHINDTNDPRGTAYLNLYNRFNIIYEKTMWAIAKCPRAKSLGTLIRIRKKLQNDDVTSGFDTKTKLGVRI